MKDTLLRACDQPYLLELSLRLTSINILTDLNGFLLIFTFIPELYYKFLNQSFTMLKLGELYNNFY